MSQRRPRVRTSLVLFVATCCTAVGLLAFLPSTDIAPSAPSAAADGPRPGRELPGSATAGASERGEASGPLDCYGAPIGSRFCYRVVDRCDYAIENDEAGSQPAASQHAECRLVTVVLDRRDAEVLVEHRLEALQFLDRSGRPVADFACQSYVAATESPVFARVDARGRVLGYAFAEGLDGEQRNFLRGMLGITAFAAPAAGIDQWSIHEVDTAGEFESTYTRLPAVEGDDVSVRRSKVRYLTIGDNAETPEHRLRGAAEARFSTRVGWLVAATIDEGMKVAVPLPGTKIDTVRRSQLVLESHERIDVSSDFAAAWQRATAPVTGRHETGGRIAQANHRRHWEKRLEGATTDSLLAELATLLAADPIDKEKLNDAFQRLQWLAKLDDSVAKDLGQRVLTGQVAGDLANIAVSSLGAAGTPAAQTALAGVRGDRSMSAGLRENATIAAMQISSPGAEILDGLVRDSADDFDGRENAVLVLGSLAPRASRPLADGRTAMATLLAMENDYAARGDTSTWLLAVGNAGSAETLSIVQRHIGSTDPSIRSAACVALRRVGDADAVPLLVDRATTDLDEIVRRDAVLELGRRNVPAARSALQFVAQNDANEDLRDRARRLLGAGS